MAKKPVSKKAPPNNPMDRMRNRAEAGGRSQSRSGGNRNMFPASSGNRPSPNKGGGEIINRPGKGGGMMPDTRRPVDPRPPKTGGQLPPNMGRVNPMGPANPPPMGRLVENINTGGPGATAARLAGGQGGNNIMSAIGGPGAAGNVAGGLGLASQFPSGKSGGAMPTAQLQGPSSLSGYKKPGASQASALTKPKSPGMGAGAMGPGGADRSMRDEAMAQKRADAATGPMTKSVPMMSNAAIKVRAPMQKPMVPQAPQRPAFMRGGGLARKGVGQALAKGGLVRGAGCVQRGVKSPKVR